MTIGTKKSKCGQCKLASVNKLTLKNDTGNLNNKNLPKQFRNGAYGNWNNKNTKHYP